MTAIPFPTLVLPDPRPARRRLAGALAAWRAARLEVAVATAAVGAVLASVLS
jgi:hypothetical protein